MLHPRGPRRRKRGHMGVMVDGPGIPRRTRAGGEAGDQHVEALAPEALPRQRGRVGDLAEAERRALREQPGRIAATGARAQEADGFVPLRHERPDGGPPDRSGGAQNEHAARFRLLGRRLFGHLGPSWGLAVLMRRIAAVHKNARGRLAADGPML